MRTWLPCKSSLSTPRTQSKEHATRLFLIEPLQRRAAGSSISTCHAPARLDRCADPWRSCPRRFAADSQGTGGTAGRSQDCRNGAVRFHRLELARRPTPKLHDGPKQLAQRSTFGRRLARRFDGEAPWRRAIPSMNPYPLDGKLFPKICHRLIAQSSAARRDNGNAAHDSSAERMLSTTCWAISIGALCFSVMLRCT